MFKERNKRRTDRNNLFRGNVHEIHFFRRSFQNIRTAAAGHIPVQERAGIRQRLAGLGNNFIFFNISRHIETFIGHFVGLRVNPAVRRFNQAVLVDNSVIGQ